MLQLFQPITWGVQCLTGLCEDSGADGVCAGASIELWREQYVPGCQAGGRHLHRQAAEVPCYILDLFTAVLNLLPVHPSAPRRLGVTFLPALMHPLSTLPESTCQPLVNTKWMSFQNSHMTRTALSALIPVVFPVLLRNLFFSVICVQVHIKPRNVSF